MNILILNWKDTKNPKAGGAEIIVYELAKRLVKEGHQVNWFCGSFKNASDIEFVEEIKVVRRGGNLFTMYLSAPFYYWSLPDKPDLVIDMCNTVFWQTPLWAWRSKKIAYINQFAREVFFYEYPPLIALLGFLLERFQYLTYLGTDFICYSNSTKQDLISVGIVKNKIKVFDLGLDHSRYASGKKSKDPLFICVNRLVRMKRTDLAIKAMKIVCSEYPTAKLVISGFGYERKNLEKLRDQLSLQSAVYFLDENNFFLEKNTKDQKIKLMQEAWALIFPSVKEGWGMTVTECAACGTPSIATDVSGLRDSVVDNKTGLLISKNPTSEELAKAMIKIIEDEDLRQKLGTESLKWSKRFSWEKSFGQFYKLIV